MSNIKLVKKPWGEELWLADGTTTPYAYKRITFNAGNRTSLQVHKFKIETNYVISGTGTLLFSKEPLDIDTFLKDGMTASELSAYIDALEVIPISSGSVFHVQPGYVHRVIAETELVFVETSTTELDDVIRLQDDSGRSHGKIAGEHSE
jgi:mannose-1-phosphate guanylyltransferase